MDSSVAQRREFEMTHEQLARLLEACKPVPYLVMGGMPPRSPQEAANRAWQTLGGELGFDWKTVRPVAGTGLVASKPSVARCHRG